jgi:hypothetical protein
MGDLANGGIMIQINFRQIMAVTLRSMPCEASRTAILKQMAGTFLLVKTGSSRVTTWN